MDLSPKPGCLEFHTMAGLDQIPVDAPLKMVRLARPTYGEKNGGALMVIASARCYLENSLGTACKLIF